MNPIQILKKDHRTVEALFRRFEKADRNAERQQLGQEIIEELSVHAAIEEQLIYPLLRERDSRTEQAVLNALEEHHAMKLTLDELDKLSADHERFQAKMHVVREQVEMHVEEEERRMLPRLDALLDQDERKEVSEAMLAMKHAAPNYPHPAAPDTPPGIGIAALVARVTDAGKDFVRTLTSPERAAGHRQVARRAASAATSRSRKPRRRARATARPKPRRRATRPTRPTRSTRSTRSTRKSGARKRAR